MTSYINVAVGKMKAGEPAVRIIDDSGTRYVKSVKLLGPSWVGHTDAHTIKVVTDAELEEESGESTH